MANNIGRGRVSRPIEPDVSDADADADSDVVMAAPTLSSSAGDRLTKSPQLEAGSSETDSLGADYASIASTIPNYIYENGRRYHCYHGDQYVRPFLLWHLFCKQQTRH